MNVSKVFKLDLLSIRPYLTWKNLIILIGLGVLYGALSKNSITVMATVQMFAILFSAYPFMVGEESGIDPLYKLFSIEAKDVVKGRYLLAVSFVVAMLFLGTVIVIIISCIVPMDDLYDILLLSVPITSLLPLLIIFIEYPLYFKYGYKKGKTLASIPFLLVGIAVMISAFLKDNMSNILQFIVINRVAGMGVLFIACIITFIISYRFSNKFYLQRDF